MGEELRIGDWILSKRAKSVPNRSETFGETLKRIRHVFGTKQQGKTCCWQTAWEKEAGSPLVGFLQLETRKAIAVPALG